MGGYRQSVKEGDFDEILESIVKNGGFNYGYVRLNLSNKSKKEILEIKDFLSKYLDNYELRDFDSLLNKVTNY